MDRTDFETSTKRAKRAQSQTRIFGNLVTDFKWVTRTETGRIRWQWLPRIEEAMVPLWNPSGGPALLGYSKRTYWLCLGWSLLEFIPEDDPRATYGIGGDHGRS